MRKKILVALITLAAVAPLISSAALLQPPPDQKPFYDVESQAFEIIKYVLGIAGALAVFALIIGGFLYVTTGAAGDSKARITQGKTIITYSITGLVFIILAYVIMATINRVIGPK